MFLRRGKSSWDVLINFVVCIYVIRYAGLSFRMRSNYNTSFGVKVSSKKKSNVGSNIVIASCDCFSRLFRIPSNLRTSGVRHSQTAEWVFSAVQWGSDLSQPT